MAGDGVPADAPAASVYCNKCGELHPLLDCIKRNDERIIISCPGCDAVWLEYTARKPIATAVEVNGVKIPPFLVVGRS